MNKFAIRCSEDSCVELAHSLADKFNLKINVAATNYVVVTSSGLALQQGEFKPLRVDFVDGKLAYRIRQAGKQQPLAKACIIKEKPTIVDLTAGWGRDAAILASLGATVTMLERHPIQALLLNDGLKRLQQSDEHWSLSLIEDDATHYLQQLNPTDLPDVIYFDPMHPSRTKSAKVKKELQVLQNIIGSDEDKEQVAQLALNKARKRLVIKWPANEPALLSQKPDTSYPGKTIRYDVYLAS